MFKNLSLLFLSALILTLFFSFRLLDTPQSLTMDEDGFGLNASTLSETLRDETGRFLPVFALSLNGRDWRQPVTQYYQALYFKLFGRSVYNLKFTSVTVIVLSCLLIFWLSQKLLGTVYATITTLLYIATPMIMIHSHLALDNIYPIPFILIWLLGLWTYLKTKSLKYLIFAGLSLGIGFYSYKGMRSGSPIFSMLTVLYIFYITLIAQKNSFKKAFQKSFKPIIFFSISVGIFFAIAPILDKKYAGAVFGFQDLSIKNPYDFIYFYISQFDPSFLFIKGDTILHHSTGTHGMLLLSTLPIFLVGIYQSIVNKNKFFIFLIISFFMAPLFVSFIGSLHRASRIIYLIPFYSLISGYGAYFIYQNARKKTFYKLLGFTMAVLIFINYADFLKYYWYEYGPATRHMFYHAENEIPYKMLYEEAQIRNLKPLMSKPMAYPQGEEMNNEMFLRSIYFPVLPEVYLDEDESKIPKGTILLTGNKVLKNVEKIEISNERALFIKN